MLYVEAKNADGTTSGGCAPVMQIGLLHHLTFLVGRFIAAAEAGAAAEAAAATAGETPPAELPAVSAVAPTLAAVPSP
jgi:hypothetical protein